MAKGKYKEWLTEEKLRVLEAWAKDGLTNEQIAANMGISRSTLNEWEKKYPDISDALKRGRDDADMSVVKLMTSIPCHLFVSIMMGYYYTMWHTRFIVNRIEKNMLSAGIVKEDKIRSSAGWLVCSIIIPMFVSSLYSFTSVNKNQTVVMVFFAVVFLIYGLSFVTINHIASKETDVANYLCRVIAKGHPELTKEDIEKGVSSDGNADKEGNK